MRYTDVQIARLYHAFNMEHQALMLDDMPSQPWPSLPRSTRAVTLQAVARIRHGGVTTGEQHHEEWYAAMTARRYVHGPEKDHEKLTHPALLHWAELPEEKRDKARMFVWIVQSLLLLGDD